MVEFIEAVRSKFYSELLRYERGKLFAEDLGDYAEKGFGNLYPNLSLPFSKPLQKDLQKDLQNFAAILTAAGAQNFHVGWIEQSDIKSVLASAKSFEKISDKFLGIILPDNSVWYLWRSSFDSGVFMCAGINGKNLVKFSDFEDWYKLFGNLAEELFKVYGTD